MAEEKTDAVQDDLTPHERECLQSLFQLCRDQGLLERPAFLAAGDAVDGLNDEATLLRFLRGRSFDVPGALKQFEEAQAIRAAVEAGPAYDSVEVKEFEHTRSMYPRWSGRRTKSGLPICTFDIANLDPSALSDYGKRRATSQATVRAVVFHDYLTRFVLPLCSAVTGRPVSSAVYLVDVASFTLKQAWNVKGYAQDVSKLLATCYPEVIDKVYVLNAAPYFARIWAVLKKLVDPRTAAKLVIVPPSDVVATLSEVIDVDSIPQQYGGKFDSVGQTTPAAALLPRLDDAAKGVLGVQELPEGPIKWTVGEDGKRVAVAVGTRDGTTPRRELVGKLQ